MTRVAERLRLLGQPVRLRLVELLVNGPSTPQELSETLGLSQQNVSKHLLSLHRAGFLSRRQDGVNVIYGLTDQSAIAILRLAVESVSGHLRDLRGSHQIPPGAINVWTGAGTTSPRLTPTMEHEGGDVTRDIWACG